jgi:hypothetical protein
MSDVTARRLRARPRPLRVTFISQAEEDQTLAALEQMAERIRAGQGTVHRDELASRPVGWSTAPRK